MLARARAHVGEGEDVSYLQLNGRDFAGVADASVDFFFSYDVLLHLQPQNVFSYLHAARRILRPGGVFLIHAINLAAPGGSYHFEVQYVQDTWSRPFEDPHRRGHVYFMSEDQLRALAELGRYSVDRLVTNWPPPGDPMVPAARGRDTLGFLRREPSLYEQMATGTVRLVRAPDERLFALADGRRREFPMPEIFEQAGLSWEAVEPIDGAELEALPADQPVSRWEL
jgi:SAM-dependent methyltransferase